MRLFLFFLAITIWSCSSEIDSVQPVENQQSVDVEIDTTTINIDTISQQSNGGKQWSDSISYLALGDSYTAGTGEATENRWPVLLSNRVMDDGYFVEGPTIIAQAGWTTRNLLSGINNKELEEKYDLVSLLIGVNNQFQELDFGIFEKEFRELLSFSIEKSNNREGVFVVSIPDYGVTPFGQYAEERISKEIDEYNEYIQMVCSEEGINFYNITQISRKAKNDLAYLAPDNLHPSKLMYEEWIDLIMSNPPTALDQ